MKPQLQTTVAQSAAPSAAKPERRLRVAKPLRASIAHTLKSDARLRYHYIKTTKIYSNIRGATALGILAALAIPALVFFLPSSATLTAIFPVAFGVSLLAALLTKQVDHFPWVKPWCNKYEKAKAAWEHRKEQRAKMLAEKKNGAEVRAENMRSRLSELLDSLTKNAEELEATTAIAAPDMRKAAGEHAAAALQSKIAEAKRLIEELSAPPTPKP